VVKAIENIKAHIVPYYVDSVLIYIDQSRLDFNPVSEIIEIYNYEAVFRHSNNRFQGLPSVPIRLNILY